MPAIKFFVLFLTVIFTACSTNQGETVVTLPAHHAHMLKTDHRYQLLSLHYDVSRKSPIPEVLLVMLPKDINDLGFELKSNNELLVYNKDKVIKKVKYTWGNNIISVENEDYLVSQADDKLLFVNAKKDTLIFK